MYRKFRVTVLVAVFLTMATNGMVGTAQPSVPPEVPVYPVDKTIEYSVHEDPADPTSDVVFVISLDLTAADLDGSWVGWQIESAEFRQPGIGGGADTVWTKSLPDVNTVDGLWWIEHADSSAPEVAEFDMPPELLGRVTADDPANADLDYDFEGIEYTPPAAPDAPPYDNTSALAFAFVEEGGGDLLLVSDGELTELDEELDEQNDNSYDPD